MNNTISRSRLLVLTLAFLTLLTVYVVSLYRLQIVEGRRYYEEYKNNVVTTETVIAARGNILDRYGRLLVTNVGVNNLIIDTGELFPSDGSVDSNAVILQLVKMVREYGDEYNDWLPITESPPFEYKEDMSSADEARLNAYKKFRGLDENATAVEVMSDMRNRYQIDSNYSAEEARIIASVRYAVNVRYLINTADYIFVEDADMKLIAQIKENNIVGVSINESYVREYQTEHAAHILGYVNWMSDAQYEQYKDTEGYYGDTKIGQEGAEKAFEKYLHGNNGVVQKTSAEDGTVVSTEYTTEPEPGNNVYLTIDIQLQAAAEQALKNGIEEIKQMMSTQDQVVFVDGEWLDKNIEVTGGAVVAVDVKTGEPLAIASYPSYDLPNLLENYNEILQEENNPLYNRALQGEYAPGSTFKPCTSIAGLTESIINTQTRLPCGGIYTKYEEYGYAPRCWIYGSGVHGPDCLPEALRDSCNCFFYEVGRQLGIDRMGKYAKLLGLGEPTGIELPENTGNMSNSATHFQWVGEDWTIGDTLQAAIGQSDSMFTPLQLAEYCATVANNGVRHSASLLKYVRSFDYSEKLFEREDEVLSQVQSPQYNWDAIHQGMYMVANEWAGSGYHVFERYNASTVACKTGTAQKGQTVSNDGIFICYAPFEDPEIAIAVVVERGGAGANCGVIAKNLLESYFALKTVTDVTDTEGALLR